MSTIKTATLNSNELSEELDDASLQAITGGVLGTASSAGTASQGSSGGAILSLPFLGSAQIYGTQGSSLSGGVSGLLSFLPF